MVSIGNYNTLRAIEEFEFGMFLDDTEGGKILLPRRYVTDTLRIGDEIEVFVYFDSEDRIVATTETPIARVGQFASLRVKEVTNVGAFLDWGLAKDLLVPFREQKVKMEYDKYYVVYIRVDDFSGRIVATAKFDKYLNLTPAPWGVDDEVDLLIINKSDLGFNAIINQTHKGLLYDNQIFQPLCKGNKVKGYINKIYDDGRIDLILQKPGFEKSDDLAFDILDILRKNDGFLAVSDKSSPEDIYSRFAMSKKTFKKAIGALYRSRLIVIETDGIRLVVK